MQKKSPQITSIVKLLTLPCKMILQNVRLLQQKLFDLMIISSLEKFISLRSSKSEHNGKPLQVQRQSYKKIVSLRI